MDYYTYLSDPETQEEVDLDFPEGVQQKHYFDPRHHSEYAVCVYKLMLWYCNIPTSVLGTVGNILVLWVWSSEFAYHPTFYLFKALAVSDILSLVFFVINECVSRSELFLRIVLLPGMVRGNRKIGVLITMLLSVVRVIKVFFPLRSEQLLSRVRMKVVLAGFTLWGLSEQLLENYLRSIDSDLLSKVNSYAGDRLSLIVPSALQIICMTVVTCRVWRFFRVDQSSSQRQAVSCQQGKNKDRQLVYSVFAMCVFTFLTYFVGYGLLSFVAKPKSAR